MNEPLVACRGLEKTFASAAEDLCVLHDLDLSIEAGSRVAITGASGCGKSTLLSILGGLDRVTGGFVRVGDWNLESIAEKDLTEYRARAVGFVFQFHYLLKDFTALENVALPAYMRGERRKDAFGRAAALLTDMGLAERLDHLPSRLSGGERQRAAIARALINRPSLVLADEPTGNLDSSSAGSVRELLFGLSGRYGTTLVLVTHDVSLAAETDLRYELSGGRLSPS
ncbi:MAG: ABC transporter ATP-binding protein [Rectinemataceae bacterium]|jgi:lipoprotein-releasing system ATP-binding protein